MAESEHRQRSRPSLLSFIPKIKARTRTGLLTLSLGMLFGLLLTGFGAGIAAEKSPPAVRQPQAQASTARQPTGLLCDLLAHPDRVSVGGLRASTPLDRVEEIRETPEFVKINTARPWFGWIVNDAAANAHQSAYQILMASTAENLAADTGDLWDSGKVRSNQSLNIRYDGKALAPNTTYHWKVRTWNDRGQASPYSTGQSFRTGDLDGVYATAKYPLEKQEIAPVRLMRTGPETVFTDFGKDAFGRVKLTLTSDSTGQAIRIHLGEVVAGRNSINPNPGGSRRYKVIPLVLQEGTHTYTVRILPDERNTGPNAMKMPEYTGEVMPFRYCEITGYRKPLTPAMIRQEVVHYPFNDQASSFWSSSQVLNDVWELCKYSIKATSFTGIYVDGDRERIPYEADAYINQLAHYGIDREYAMARATQEYLITHPTWPTEWIMHSVLMAWEDYMYTGNPASLEQFYTDLQAKTLAALERKDGLISTQTGLVTDDVLQSIHFQGKLRDIVDWPHTGILGLNEGEGGETDGFVFTPINTVVNAFHYRALVLMGRIARTLGKAQDARIYEQKAALVKQSFNRKLFNEQTGAYVDGEGTDHSSLHANMFALAFGLVPEDRVATVVDFIESRGMACSVYGAQHLMDALYEGGADLYAMDLLTSTTDRSWAHMTYDVGSTITLEAWDDKYKPNMDWNHAWGAAPANIIPRRVVGVRPLEPGFEKIIIQPQPGDLRAFRATVPTIRGPVHVNYRKDPDGTVTIRWQIPANTTARFEIEQSRLRNGEVSLDGARVRPGQEDRYAVLDNVGSGSHTVQYQE